MPDTHEEDWPAPLIRPQAIDALLRRAPSAHPSGNASPSPVSSMGPGPASSLAPSPVKPPRRGIPGQAVFAALVIIAGVWAASGFYKVEPDQVGIVLRLGRWVGTRSPGLNYHWPYPIETVLLPRVTQANQLKISGGATQMLTGDENIVEATAAIFWRINDPVKYLFNVTDPEAIVRIAGESAVRQVIGFNPIQAGLSDQRQKIADEARERLQKLLDSYDLGVTVTGVQLQRVDPPTAVIDAFNDVQRARADQERARNEAEAYGRDILPRARGEAERIKQEAQAYRQQVVNAAAGDASRFTSLNEAYHETPAITGRRLYLDTMEEVLRSANKIILDPSGAGGSKLVPYLPLSTLPAAPTAVGKAP